MNRSLLLLGIFLLLSPNPAQTASDYKYIDEDDNEIIFPAVTTVWTQSSRGPWSEEEARWHLPHVEARFRKDGLENIRFVRITLDHPPGKSKDGTLKAIYLRDKDQLIIGYHSFSPSDKVFEFKSRLNGVVNYLEIFVFCVDHGVWKSEVRLPLDK